MMNNRWLMVWLQLEPGWLRLTSFCGGALLLTFLLWYGWLYPARRQQQQQEQQLHQHILQYQQQLRSLAVLPPLTVSQRRVNCLQRLLLPATAVDLSLPALLLTSGAELEYWHPTEHGGKLAVTLQWPQFAGLLNYLSELRPVPAFPAFSLKREEAKLRLMMELIDES